MAVGIVHHYAGGTAEQYEAARAAVHPEGGLPDGQTHHFAGPTSDGWLVVTIWESREVLDTFLANKLIPALASLGDSGFQAPPVQTDFEVFRAETG